MQPVPPFWFQQRQGKVEAAGPESYRLTAPNLGEAFIRVHRAEDSRWSAGLRFQVDGPEVRSTAPLYDTEPDAWSAAFELYREQLII
jgi:hypothetical protein